jgi:hypothetical protein
MNIGDRVRGLKDVMTTETSKIPVGATGKIIDYSNDTYIIALDEKYEGLSGSFDWCRTFPEHMNYFWEKI